jgi:hypothetical protein
MTARSIPLLSPDVPWFMPQTCPRHLWGYESFERRSVGAQPTRNQPIYWDLGVVPTGSRPGLFPPVSAGLVSKP